MEHESKPTLIPGFADHQPCMPVMPTAQVVFPAIGRRVRTRAAVPIDGPGKKSPGEATRPGREAPILNYGSVIGTFTCELLALLRDCPFE